MNCWKKIHCEEKCPIGKKCCFGEFKHDGFNGKKIIERHKCKSRKSTGKEYVEVVVG